MTIGERIGIIAREKEPSLRKVAEKAGISYNTLYSLVTRKSNKIDMETLQKIADALDVQPWELMGYDGSIRVDTSKHSDKPLSEQLEDFYNALRKLGETFPKEDRFFYCFYKLNQAGQQKLMDYLEDLAKIPEYQKKDEPSQE